MRYVCAASLVVPDIFLLFIQVAVLKDLQKLNLIPVACYERPPSYHSKSIIFTKNSSFRSMILQQCNLTGSLQPISSFLARQQGFCFGFCISPNIYTLSRQNLALLPALIVGRIMSNFNCLFTWYTEACNFPSCPAVLISRSVLFKVNSSQVITANVSILSLRYASCQLRSLPFFLSQKFLGRDF